MKTTAKDIMVTDYKTLAPDSPIADALQIFKDSIEEKNTIFGIMVLDAGNSIAGVISMYDILLFLLPKHVKIWGNISDIEIEGIIDQAAGKLGPLLVGDIMTPKVITISPRTHLMMILDIMIKKHIRLIPVVEDDHPAGIVNISDLFHHLLQRA